MPVCPGNVRLPIYQSQTYITIDGGGTGVIENTAEWDHCPR